MKINTQTSPVVNFKGITLAPLSQALYTLGNNDMLNASFIDVFAMDTPRTIVEFEHRGKQAGIEMGFREYTGTFIAEFSAIVFALAASKLFSKKYKPDVKINGNSWLTNNAIDAFSEIYNKSDKTLDGFLENTLKSMSGISGKKVTTLSDSGSENIKSIKEGFIDIINNTKLDKKAKTQALKNLEDNIIQTLKADNNITLQQGVKGYSDNLSHIVRDIIDVSQNVFFKEGANSKSIIEKLKTLNKSRIAIAIPLSMLLAITNQYINRYLTKKRTGIDNFVGENDYEKNVQGKNETKKEKGLLVKKALSACIFLLMLSSVMGLKKPKDIINKLEFNGAATGGNAIKTIYGTLILGRIFASKDSTELRETNVRDYLGFLSWLVLGGFVAKGVGQILDPKQAILFNVTKQGNGIKHWLKDISLKSQKEIIAQGGNVKQNLRKLNIAQLSGIAYSAIMLGVLLPKLNIWMTKHKKNTNEIIAKSVNIHNLSNPFLGKNTPDIFKEFSLKQAQ
ncbi:hypothetical protein HDR58_04210 [bacterium]|nr:hypothetical protein [bacterium]